MNQVKRFIRNLEYLSRKQPGKITNLKLDIAYDLEIFFQLIEEMSNSPSNRSTDHTKALESLADQSFNMLLDKYPRIILYVNLGDLRREALSLKRAGFGNELLHYLTSENGEVTS